MKSAGFSGMKRKLDLSPSISRTSLSRRIDVHLLGRDLRTAPPPRLREAYREQENKIKRLYSRVLFWHGSGRFRYRTAGESDGSRPPIDVLEKIMDSGGLEPHSDVWDFTLGSKPSVSVTPHRMYARIYAQFYQGPNSALEYQFGDRSRWSVYFLYPTFLKGVLEYIIHKKGRVSFDEFFPRAREFWDWIGKINRGIPRNRPLPFGYFSSITSDIPGNYGLIFGIKGSAVPSLRTAPYIARHEKRIPGLIRMEDMTHIEAPLRSCRATEKLLRAQNHRLPVLPIELGDLHCRRSPIRQLVWGNTHSS